MPGPDRTPGIFRLLLRAPDPRGVALGTVDLAGFRWSLIAFAEFPADEEVRPFTCISYSWGPGRGAHPLDPAHSVSDRAIPAFETVVAALNPPAIWIDALCVPTEEPAREACLLGLGSIYGGAAQVAMVLSKSCAPALEQIRMGKLVDDAGLQALEGDDWVTRVWTVWIYQEVANSRTTLFVSEGGGGPVESDTFLNKLGQSCMYLKKAEGIDEFEFQARFPRIDRLENILVDTMVADVEQRFAYQVMAGMSSRSAEGSEDYFYPMIGAIASDPSQPAPDPSLPRAERFRQACEARSDYSFIYCVAPRSREAGKSWRPAAEAMPVVLSWHTYGKGQMGQLNPTHLRLEGMYMPQHGALQSSVAVIIRERLAIKESNVPAKELARAAYERLMSMGFNGSGDPLEMETGYFFAQAKLPDAGMRIAVATQVRWAFGAPGLVLEENDNGICRFRDVGLFVGEVPQAGEPVDVG